MKSVTTDFSLAQSKPGSRRVREVYYKRRYWDAGDSVYKWETDWRNVEKRATTTVSAPDEVVLFELTDGTSSYDSAPNDLIKFHDADEFGFHGAVDVVDSAGGTGTIYYLLEVLSKDIDRSYHIRFYNDEIRNTVDSTTYTFDATGVHAYRFVIKADLSLDLYVDDVFAQNMGDGSSGLSGGATDRIQFSKHGFEDPDVPDVVNYLPTDIPGNVDPPWTQAVGGGETVNDESVSGGVLTVDVSGANGLTYKRPIDFSSGGSFRLDVLSATPGASPGSSDHLDFAINSDALGIRWGFRFFNDGIYSMQSNTIIYAMDCGDPHIYDFIINMLTGQLDILVDEAAAASETGDSGGVDPEDTVTVGISGTIVAEFNGWQYSNYPAWSVALDRIWYQLTTAALGGAGVVTPEIRATSRVVQVGSVSWQLDSEQLTEFKVANVGIIAENSRNEWDPANPSGHFAPDDVAEDGYEPYWTKFQIRSGYELADGSTELVNLFTGLAVAFRRGSNPRNVQLDILGQEAFMLNSAAEDIATHLTDESLGTGDGVTVDFETANPGVGGVSEVKVDGAVLIEGSDYTVSQLNETALPAKITFTNAPDLTFTVEASYFYWPQNISFSDLVELLVDEWLNSDPENSTDIEPFVVSNNVINSQEYTSAGDWNTGTLTRMSSSQFSGSLSVDWENSAFRQSTVWANSLSGWTVYGDAPLVISSTGSLIEFLIPSGKVSGIQNGYVERAYAGVVGSWEFKVQMSSGPTPAAYQFLKVKLFTGAGAAGFDGSFTITRTNTVSPAPVGNFFGVSYAAIDGSEHTFKVTRTASGVIKLYIDGSLTATSSYSTTAATMLGFNASMTRGIGFTGGSSITVRDIYVPTLSGTAQWEGPVIDWATTPFAWGAFDRVDDLDRNGSIAGATIQYYTNSSADNFSTSDGYVEIPRTQTTPTATVRRYLKEKIIITVDQTTSAEPVVNSTKIRTISESTPILLPKLTGKNVYESIQDLAAFAHYEFGITSDQVFFFRPRDPNADSVLSLSEKDQIEEIADFNNGYENVYSKVEITYGNYTKRIEGDATDPTDAAARFLKKTFEFSANENIQIAATADIATAMSQEYFQFLSVLRRRFRVITKFLPQLEISDICLFSYKFDPDAEAEEKLLELVPGKIISARYDTDRYQCEFEVEEVVT